MKKLIKKWHSKDLSIQRKQQTSVENLKTISGLQSVVPKEVTLETRPLMLLIHKNILLCFRIKSHTSNSPDLIQQRFHIIPIRNPTDEQVLLGFITWNLTHHIQGHLSPACGGWKYSPSNREKAPHPCPSQQSSCLFDMGSVHASQISHPTLQLL